jgi:TM2 domain-containing membrane protein YozV
MVDIIDVKVHNPTKRLYNMNQAGTAAVLSFLIPGVGQIYNGDFLRAIFWLIITPGVWFVTASTMGWVCHLIAAYTAYRRGQKLMGTG